MKYLTQEDGTPYTAESFDIDQYLIQLDQLYQGRLDKLLAKDFGRRELTKYDPLLFAITYMPDTLKEGVGHISFSDAHLDFCRDAISWTEKNTEPKANRTAYIEPRGQGKSTWMFKILPLWAAAHKHRRFIAAVSDSATQSQEHLETFRRELDENDFLRADYIKLCTPAKRNGKIEHDSRTDYRSASGFVFKTRGMDSSILGMKDGDKRPDLIILDDIEKGESKYSIKQAGSRLITLMDTILPLEPTAVVVLTGTVNMVGSIVDDLARSVDNSVKASWIESTNFKVRYHHAIVKNDDGSERSVWPDKWPLEWLIEERATDPRGFAKQFENAPIASDGIYWDRDMFKYGRLETASIELLSIDPAVSSKSTSDWTGISIVRYSKAIDMFEINNAHQVRMNSRQLRSRVIHLLEQNPNITALLIETNQGGDLWIDQDGVFFNLPVKVITVNQKESKELRAERALLEWTKGKVLMQPGMTDLERQLLSFPNSLHDDIVDSVTSAIIDIRKRTKIDSRKIVPFVQKGQYTK
jgi:phage terminase large subunit-like protein